MPKGPIISAAAYDRLSQVNKHNWLKSCFALVDSGATDHIVHDHVHLSNYTPFRHSITVTVGDGKKLYAAGYGTLVLTVSGNRTVLFPKTLHVPGMKCNVLSVTGLGRAGFTTCMDEKRACIFDSHDTSDCPAPVLHANMCDNLYLLDLTKQNHAKVTVPDRKHYAKFLNAMSSTSCDTEADAFAQSLCMTAAHLYQEHSVAHVEHSVVATAHASVSDADLWHYRLGHPSKTATKLLCGIESTHLPSFDVLQPKFDTPCLHCLEGSFPQGTHQPLPRKATEPCELVHADLCGPLKQGHGNNRFILNLVDSYSGYTFSVPMQDKADTHTHLKDAIMRLQQISGKPVKHIRSDKGSEFFNPDVMHLLGELCINFSSSAPYTPQQNGVVERANRSLMEITRSLLCHAHRQPYQWPLAYKHASYLFNRRVSASRSTDKTRHELFTGTAPTLQHLRVWGSKCYVKVPNQLLQGKLQPRAVTGIYVGVDEYSVGYKVLVNNVVYIRQDVVFSESELGNSVNSHAFEIDLQDMELDVDTEEPTPAPAQHAPAQHAHASRKRREPMAARSPAAHTRSKTKHGDSEHEHSMHAVHTEMFVPPVFGDATTTSDVECIVAAAAAGAHTSPHPSPVSPVEPVKPLIEQDAGTYSPPFPAYVPGAPLPVPESLNQAQKSELWPHWHRAMQDEYNSLKQMNVFQMVELPAGERALSSKWVYTFKHNDVEITKCKARLVARGYEQREDIDYDLLFSPTVSQSSLKLMLSYAAQHNCYIHQLDVKTAFLHGTLDRPVYLKQPVGCDDFTGRVWLLIRSLYGLKQAPRAWYCKLQAELALLGFIACPDDSALFYKHVDSGRSKIFICVHVDDMLIIHQDKELVLQTVEQIKQIFSVTDLGAASNYLKMHIVNTPKGIMLHQSDYVQSLLNKFWDKSRLTPSQFTSKSVLPYDFKFVKFASPYGNKDDHVPCDPTLYRQIVGSLMYLSTSTRPDIAWCVNQLCRYFEQPSLNHYLATQYLFRYLNHTADYGLLFKNTSAPAVTGYCDASHHSCMDTCRSCTGFCFNINGTVVSWNSHMQSVIALSTAESEYMAISNCGREAVWLQRLHQEVFSTPYTPLQISMAEITPSYSHDTTSKQVDKVKSAQLIYNDNQSAISMVRDNHSSKLTKHISKVFHWAREKVTDGTLRYEHIAGTENQSDILTKWLPTVAFEKHRDSMGVVSLKACVE